MKRKEYLRLPYNLDRSDRLQDLDDGHIRHVSLACGCQAAIKSDLE